jgi:putative transposase
MKTMPRRARVIIPNSVYHVLNRGNNKETVFFDDQDFNTFLQIVKIYKGKFGLPIFHYCLMPNHKHFLPKPRTSQDLSKFMQGITLVYSQYVKEKYGRVGHIWQGRYKSPIIGDESYLARCGFYIEDNPRRAGLVKDLKDWAWSSYNFYAYGKYDPVVDVDPNYLSLGKTPEERQRNYREFIKNTQDATWIEEIQQKLGRPGNRGRPKYRINRDRSIFR